MNFETKELHAKHATMTKDETGAVLYIKTACISLAG